MMVLRLAGNLISENYIMTDHYSTPCYADRMELAVNLSTKETDSLGAVVVTDEGMVGANIQLPLQFTKFTSLILNLENEEELI